MDKSQIKKLALHQLGSRTALHDLPSLPNFLGAWEVPSHLRTYMSIIHLSRPISIESSILQNVYKVETS
jgi:hypothetical protein